ncbi:hypothetical protein Bca52824_064326 [Brassica carinata]|uniref:Ubiquitin-like domain-containing protein n=1 Tax=Brassica carinata TaxID=52824 RepID=A0A8X7QG33_BRACI|nr:hypothetical protein Bca52824_064326 [Brassica carinata]
MTTTKVAVQPQGPLADRKFIKKKKKKKKHKHNRVAGGNEIVDVETSKHNEESQIHEKSLLNSDRKHVDCDIGNTSHKPKKKRKKQKGSRNNEIIFEGSLKHESLQKELKRANMKEGYEKLAAMKREPDRMRVEISIQNKKVSVDRQEEELEISIVVKRLEQQKTSKTEANLKKQTEESLMAQDEANKLQEEAMKRLGEANETMGNFRRLRKEAESINCQTETLSICFREERDNIPDEMDALRNQQKRKLDNDSTEDLLNKMKRREVSAESLSRSETTRLQIFVKMMSGGKTIVIYTNKNDSVEQLHHRIELKTKIPVKETCVIYIGEQDSSLHLLGRSDTMYAVSRMLRGDWFVAINNSKEILVTLFPKKRKKATCEYLRILLNSSVPAALVMLFACPLEINRSCAKSLINLCFDSCKDLSDNQQRCYSLVVLEVFRLLKRICSRNKLYVSCRNTLGSVLDLFLGIKMHKKEMEYCIESKREEFEDSWKGRKKKLEKECIQSLKESTKKELEHVQVELKRLDTERLNIKLNCKWREKEWAELRDSVEELKIQRKKLERQNHMLRFRREDIRHENEELKNLENLKVALDDISTEVVKWEMAVRFEISNLEESGMENYSMIHISMKYGVKRSKSELEKYSDAIRYMRNVGYRETRLKLSWCVRMIRRDMQRFEVFRRAAMKIHETYIGRVAHIFYCGERLIVWANHKLKPAKIEQDTVTCVPHRRHPSMSL